jgi:tetratricopeptide (TPR) repeat protein
VANDNERATPAGTGRALVRRAALRPEIRAALALEEAGELQEAARVFEYAGEHAQAAVLRIEHANTVRDEGERLDVLREGCARNPGTTDEGRALHAALARLLLTRAHAVDEGSARRSLQLEAARALEEAGDAGAAGELYETLGLLNQAAAAFERGGEIAKLEVVLEILERHDDEESALVDLERQVDLALDNGQRRHAWMLLTDHVAHRKRLGRGPRPSLLRRLRWIEAARLRPDRIDIGWNGGRVTRLRAGHRFRIGRAPDVEFPVPGPRLSRHHVELSIDVNDDAGPHVLVADLGSKLGSFWEGEPLSPGLPVAMREPGQLGLGMTATVDVHPLANAGALLRLAGDANAPWSLFLPDGGPLALSPEIRVPARILFDRGWVVLDFASGVGAHLGTTPLTTGGSIELLIGDRIALAGAPLRMEVLA